ncbi:hypothetical protein [Streptomyces lincolnensis]|uniref:hypothetical protein n=1 Tax=Streptomyces lincolnensis TaxID=1915 RepID=UPI0037D229F0
MTQKSSARRAFSRPARWLSLLAGLSLLTTSPISPVQAAPAALPGGKTTFVVATAKLHDGTVHDNWTQLGWYRFNASNSQVEAETFVWRQDAPAKELVRERAGVLPDTDCSGGTGQVTRCQVMTAPRYSARSSPQPPVHRTGGYHLRTEGGTVYLDIRWPRGVTETWSVHPMPGLARLDWVRSNNATAGYAYGSNAPISARREMATVNQHPELPYVSTSWTKNDAKGEVWHKPGLRPTGYRRCDSTSWCMTQFQKTSGACKDGCGRDRPMTSIQYYLARVSSKDRRDTWWHWCTCLAPHDGACYSGNSHIKPLLQVIDDDHKFRGYVGAEASFYPYRQAEGGPRRHDMLSVFRMAEPEPASGAVRMRVQ